MKPFITEWNTQNTGTSNSNQITLPLTNTGTYHACGVTQAGGIKCWGESYLGDGNGKATSHNPVSVTSSETFTEVYAGAHVTCALTDAGKVQCWGIGNSLGDGNNTTSTTPVAVSGNHTFVSLSVAPYGESTTGSAVCGLTDTSQLYCWGYNNWGQLGLGSSDTSDKYSPTQITY